jgi:transposase
MAKPPPEKSGATKNSRTVESITVLPVTTCERCGHSLANVPCRCIVRCSRIDIVFEKTVEHMDAEVKHCPSCGHANRTTFPDGMQGELQYGLGIKAYTIDLVISQMV